MGKATSRLQAATAALMLAILAVFGAQPAVATDVDPVPSTEQPSETPQPDPNPKDPLPVDPVPGNPVPVIPPVTPVEPSPAPVESSPAPVPVPDPVAPPVAPVVPPAVEPAQPANPQPLPTMLPEQVPVTANQDAGEVANLEAPVETETPAAAIPSPTPTPVSSKTANPPVAAADIAGPLKVALAPVAENNPLIQGVTVLVLILLGVAYFRALRSKGVPGPRLNGK